MVLGIKNPKNQVNRIATLSKLYQTVTGIIMDSLKGNSNMHK